MNWLVWTGFHGPGKIHVHDPEVTSLLSSTSCLFHVRKEILGFAWAKQCFLQLSPVVGKR